MFAQRCSLSSRAGALTTAGLLPLQIMAQGPGGGGGGRPVGPGGGSPGPGIPLPYPYPYPGPSSYPYPSPSPSPSSSAGGIVRATSSLANPLNFYQWAQITGVGPIRGTVRIYNQFGLVEQQM